jgi:hypothetical protein
MIVAFSFCESDKLMALELARHIEAMGSVSRHDCLLLHPKDVDAREIAEVLQPAFGDFEALEYVPRLNGWPDGPNQCFQVAAKSIWLRREETPWLWLEADCVPTMPEWLDKIEAEYRFCGKSILGVLNDTFGLDGKVIGKHVTGVAVYPQDFWSKCAPIRSIVDASEMYRRNGACPPAFDVYIAPYAVPKCAPSNAIRHYWKSHSYKENEAGQIECRFTTPYGASNVVKMDTPLIHGCKDFTLLDLVQNGLTGGAAVCSSQKVP